MVNLSIALPDVPLVPVVPDVPLLPDVPDVPLLPDVPELPLVPVVPDVPLVPSWLTTIPPNNLNISELIGARTSIPNVNVNPDII
jgi:hypothetical protein